MTLAEIEEMMASGEEFKLEALAGRLIQTYGPAFGVYKIENGIFMFKESDNRPWRKSWNDLSWFLDARLVRITKEKKENTNEISRN